MSKLRQYWQDLKVTVWYGLVVTALLGLLVLALWGLTTLLRMPVGSPATLDGGPRVARLVLGEAHAAGVTAYNPRNPRLSLAPAGGSGGGPPTMVLSPTPAEGQEVSWITTVYRTLRMALASKNWVLLVAAAMIALLQGAKVLLTPRVPFLRTDRGGVALALGAGICTAVANAAMAGAWSGQVILEAVYFGVIYAGGYASVKKLWAPSGVDRAQLVEAKGQVAGEKAATAAGASAQSAADAINAILGDSSPGQPSPVPAPSAPPTARPGEDRLPAEIKPPGSGKP